VIAGLLGGAVVLSATGVLPGQPLFYLGTAALIGGLWFFADRGGRMRGPLSGPLQAIGLVAATLLAIWLFDQMFTRLR
jgi:hypothetical protein